MISGFEPLDLLHSILMLIQQVNEERCEVEIQYTRAVNRLGIYFPNKSWKSFGVT